jgi:Cdc6-like AAA superfamily ATPase
VLLGRDRECAALDRLLEDARDSRSGSLVLRGEPGIGKSALVAYAVDRADGMRVLSSSPSRACTSSCGRCSTAPTRCRASRAPRCAGRSA